MKKTVATSTDRTAKRRKRVPLRARIEDLLVRHGPNNSPGWWRLFQEAVRKELAK